MAAVHDTFTFECQQCFTTVSVVKGQEQPHPCSTTGVNGGPGISYPPDGADDAPNKPKGVASNAPAPVVDTLTDFLLARITEDEVAARAATWGEPGYYSVYSYLRTVDGLHVERHEPARVLADCEARRRVVEHEMSNWGITQTVKILAGVYADHPDYREEWRP